MSSKKKKVIIAPLNWGLGHATRCIPVINWFSKNGWDVHVAGNGDSLLLLMQEYPDLKFHDLPGFEVNYSGRMPLALCLLWKWPGMKKSIKCEHEALDRLIVDIKPSLLFSDNRYGCYSHRVYSVILTHQLQLPLKKWLTWLRPFSKKWMNARLKNFNCCLVPDHPDLEDSIAGLMASNDYISIPVKYLGPLSRLQKTKKHFEYEYEIMALLSGPEPAKSKLRNKIIGQLLKMNVKALVVGGTMKRDDSKTLQNLHLIDHLNTSEIEGYLAKSKIIIAGAGYSTIMDLIHLNRKALLIPTPGQWEQEYLAEYLKNHPLFLFQKQKNLDIVSACSILSSRDEPLDSHIEGKVFERTMAQVELFSNT